MANERIIENIVRTHFQNDPLTKQDRVVIEEQQSRNIKVDKLLKNASKSGSGNGYPVRVEIL